MFDYTFQTSDSPKDFSKAVVTKLLIRYYSAYYQNPKQNTIVI